MCYKKCSSVEGEEVKGGRTLHPNLHTLTTLLRYGTKSVESGASPGPVVTEPPAKSPAGVHFSMIAGMKHLLSYPYLTVEPSLTMQLSDSR